MIYYIILNFSSNNRFFSSTTIAPISACVGTGTCAFTDASVAAERACRSYLLASINGSELSSSSSSERKIYVLKLLLL